MLVIGLVGKKGSGKGEFVKIFKRLHPKTNIEVVSGSGILSTTLNLWHLPNSRKNLQKLAQLMEDFGNGALAKAVEFQIKQSSAEITILDSVSWEANEKVVRQFLPNILVAIKCLPTLRYQRSIKRSEKYQEVDLSFSQFMEEENSVNETIENIYRRADVTIDNNLNLESLTKQIQSIKF